MHSILQQTAAGILKDVEERKEGPYTRYRKLVNRGFLKRFDDTNLSKVYLREFIYALDHLDEMGKMAYFPKGRIINTPDLINLGRPATDLLNKFNGNDGITVSDQVLDMAQEFNDYDYPLTIAKILKGIGDPGVVMSLDGLPFYIGIVQETPHPLLSLIVYHDIDKDFRIFMPFLKCRTQPKSA